MLRLGRERTRNCSRHGGATVDLEGTDLVRSNRGVELTVDDAIEGLAIDYVDEAGVGAAFVRQVRPTRRVREADARHAGEQLRECAGVFCCDLFGRQELSDSFLSSPIESDARISNRQPVGLHDHGIQFASRSRECDAEVLRDSGS